MAVYYIQITDLATWFEDLLNNGENVPSDLYFKVAIDGFHLDNVLDKSEGKNFIPVFLRQTGGKYEPIEGIPKYDASFEFTFYFPVRFREQFYAINNWLAKQLVGQTHAIDEYKENSLLFTMDVATFGEINTIDLTQFKEWVETTYQKPMNVSENFMTMTIKIYCSYVSGFWGNDLSDITLVMTHKTTSVVKKIVNKWLINSFSINNTPSSQQLLGVDKYAKNIVNITANTYYFKLLLKDSDLLTMFFNNQLNDYTYRLQFNCLSTYSASTINFDKEVILLDAQPNIAYGEPITMALTFGDAI